MTDVIPIDVRYFTNKKNKQIIIIPSKKNIRADIPQKGILKLFVTKEIFKPKEKVKWQA